MSPYPSKVTPELIVHRARGMIESEGVEALSLNKLAAELGIAAPSLYNHFRNKTALLQAVNLATTQALISAIHTAVTPPDEALTRLIRMALAYRDFAHANPRTYDLAFTSTIQDLHIDSHLAEQLALPLQALMAEHVGDAESLPALRGIWALIHGFVMLELSGQFRRGGDLNAVFEQGVTAYLDGWLSHPHPT
jgi:AcrR family transcriptional regulator